MSSAKSARLRRVAAAAAAHEVDQVRSLVPEVGGDAFDPSRKWSVHHSMRCGAVWLFHHLRRQGLTCINSETFEIR